MAQKKGGKVKIKVKQSAQLRKKGEQPKDMIPKAPARVYRDTGANFKIKIRRK